MTVDPKIICEKLNIPFQIDLSSYHFVRHKIQIIPYSIAKKWHLLPVDEEGGCLVVALEDPLNLEALDEVRYITGKKTQEICASHEAIEWGIEQCYHQKEDATSSLLATLKQGSPGFFVEAEGYDLLAQTADPPVIRLINLVMTEAIQQGVSDIHFEPSDQGLIIRYRIDGVLQPRHISPQEIQLQVITRIKVLAKLDIAEQRLPQDGRIKLNIGGREIDFRVSTLPTIYGERVVLRILDRSNVVLGVEYLGMSLPILEKFKKVFSLREGILLVTGPTGSGKTTTLYSVINQINSSGLNIMTIEDPVEYKLSNMAQISVNPKIDLSFAKGLKHILRQDPDVIMIGEIRDRETAEIAIQASLTGHFVLSTLHTNDAPSALTRLVDMGIEPYLLSSTVVGVLAQRLVRVNCPHCKESYEPTALECEQLRIETSTRLYRSIGCSLCFDLGYKGRRGIYELMIMSQTLKNQIIKSADAGELRRVALIEGMTPLITQGRELISLGVTTLSEVLRVARSYEGG